MKKKEITVEFAEYFYFKFEFNDDVQTMKLCKEINNFWGGAEDRLEDAENCLFKCVSRLIIYEIIRLQMKSSFYCGVNAAIQAFNDGIEGFPSIDGSMGIKLIRCDDFELQDLYVNYEEKEINNRKK